MLWSVCDGKTHRYNQPANIFLHRDEGGEVVKLLDFGIAQFFDSSDGNSVCTRSGEEMVGTLCYMSPEQMDGIACDGKTDVYGLGVVLALMRMAHRELSDAAAYGVRGMLLGPTGPSA